MSQPLSLTSAIKDGRLPEFIAQEEGRGVGPAAQSELELAIKLLATQPRSEDQTSRSSSGDCSTEK
jgi:hypothetical protein